MATTNLLPAMEAHNLPLAMALQRHPLAMVATLVMAAHSLLQVMAAIPLSLAMAAHNLLQAILAPSLCQTTVLPCSPLQVMIAPVSQLQSTTCNLPLAMVIKPSPLKAMAAPNQLQAMEAIFMETLSLLQPMALQTHLRVTAAPATGEQNLPPVTVIQTLADQNIPRVMAALNPAQLMVATQAMDPLGPPV